MRYQDSPPSRSMLVATSARAHVTTLPNRTTDGQHRPGPTASMGTYTPAHAEDHPRTISRGAAASDLASTSAGHRQSLGSTSASNRCSSRGRGLILSASDWRGRPQLPPNRPPPALPLGPSVITLTATSSLFPRAVAVCSPAILHNPCHHGHGALILARPRKPPVCCAALLGLLIGRHPDTGLELGLAPSPRIVPPLRRYHSPAGLRRPPDSHDGFYIRLPRGGPSRPLRPQRPPSRPNPTSLPACSSTSRPARNVLRALHYFAERASCRCSATTSLNPVVSALSFALRGGQHDFGRRNLVSAALWSPCRASRAPKNAPPL